MNIAQTSILTVLAAGSLAAQGAKMAEVGAEANYAFSKALINGKGVRSLEELRGRPVLIEFWGTR